MNIVTKTTGTQLSASEFNQIPDELENLISSGSIIPSDATMTQVADAVAQIASDGRYFSVSGTANAITLSAVAPRRSIKSLTNGLSGMFKANSDNTDAVTINLCDLGAKPAYKNNSALVAGDIEAGKYYHFIYDLANERFEIADFINTVDDLGALDFEYPQKDFIQADGKSAIKILAKTKIQLQVSGEDEPRLYQTNVDTSYTLSEILDTGSVQAGKDYYIYLVAGDGETVNVVASLNSTYPQGFSASNSRKIGGLHTLCVSVTTSNCPALVDTNIWSVHPARGFSAGDIIPNSVWCLAHRPISDPSGMVYVDKIDKWVDIYLYSGTLTGSASVYGATITVNRIYIMMQWDMHLVNKELPSDRDFMVFAEGSNQCTAIKGSAQPNPNTAGGHLDTAGKRMISGYFVEECCGRVWQILDEFGPTGGSSFASYGDGDARGKSYGMPYQLGAGGDWYYSSSCGSRSRLASGTRSYAYASHGCRGVSRPLILNR